MNSINEIMENAEFQKEYDEWLAGTLNSEKAFMDKRPMETRLMFLEQKMEEICQQIVKLNSIVLKD